MSEAIRLDRPVEGGEVRSIYVHAPFCTRRCAYCDFSVTVRPDATAREWLTPLGLEWELLKEEGVAHIASPLRTLYVGGGTPSLLGTEAMAGLLRILGADLLASPELEWTAEANPEDLTPDVAAAWLGAGVNRVSLGAQSFDSETLRWMGRLHGPDDPHMAVEAARSAGIDNISLDLIFGLPEGLPRSWEEDLAKAVALEVPHVSLYGLTVAQETSLGRAVAEGREQLPEEERYREEYLFASRFLTGHGYVHYEVSNFALPGRESRHNPVYWTGEPYLGLGSSAHSYLHPRRRWNLREWEAYSNAVTAGRLPLQEEEILDDRALRMERIWLGLRTSRGLAWTGLPELAGELGRAWIETGLALDEEEALRLTPTGWLLLDELTVELERCVAEP
jgi:oxygen-independent coproporphyrinogen-3 oxidase